MPDLAESRLRVVWGRISSAVLPTAVSTSAKRSSVATAPIPTIASMTMSVGPMSLVTATCKRLLEMGTAQTNHTIRSRVKALAAARRNAQQRRNRGQRSGRHHHPLGQPGEDDDVHRHERGVGNRDDPGADIDVSSVPPKTCEVIAVSFMAPPADGAVRWL